MAYAGAETARAVSFEEQALISAWRERSLSRLLVAYISTGLGFLVVPGTLMGLWNLISISSGRSADAASAPWIQAHGHAQIFGWVGSFILGIGFYSIPKLRHSAWFPLSTGWLCWVLWTSGILMRWGAGVWSWNWRLLMPLSAAVELTAFVLFFQSVLRHHSGHGRRSKPEVWVVAVTAGTAGLMLSLVLNLIECLRLAVAGDHPIFPHAFDQRFLFAATWGFLVPVVWGFSTRWMPVFLGLKPQRATMIAASVALDLVGVVSALAGWFRLSAFLLLGAVAVFIAALRLWDRVARSPKIRGVHQSFPAFIRLSYGWLVVASLLGIWASWTGGPGIWGASRHALTVGFIATMIFSVGPRVLPAFSGMKPLYSTDLMFAAQALLTFGCALRVAAEIAAYQGYAGWAWWWLPVSGLAEFAAVLIFAANLALSFLGRSIVPLRGD